MARPAKVGLDYFGLDVKMNDEVEIIEAQHGLEGFAILIKLFQRIYSEGYYHYWTDREQILLSNRINVDRNKLISVVKDCIKWGIFDEELYIKHEILTSRRIQEHYFTATYKRVNVQADKRYLLIDISDRTNIEYIKVTDDRNKDTSSISTVQSTQSKVKETKVKKSIKTYSATEIAQTYILDAKEAEKEAYKQYKKLLIESNFERVWKLYPNKRGKGQVKATRRNKIYKLGSEIDRCISRYIEHVEEIRKNDFPELKFQNGSTFFNSGYVDYLDENYKFTKEGGVDGGNNSSDTETKGEYYRLKEIAIEEGLINKDGTIEDFGEVDF